MEKELQSRTNGKNIGVKCLPLIVTQLYKIKQNAIFLEADS